MLARNERPALFVVGQPSSYECGRKGLRMMVRQLGASERATQCISESHCGQRCSITRSSGVLEFGCLAKLAEADQNYQSLRRHTSFG
jgi:hypothetical protein